MSCGCGWGEYMTTAHLLFACVSWAHCIETWHNGVCAFVYGLVSVCVLPVCVCVRVASLALN